jgi:hypothetical protein
MLLYQSQLGGIVNTVCQLEAVVEKISMDYVRHYTGIPIQTPRKATVQVLDLECGLHARWGLVALKTDLRSG